MAALADEKEVMLLQVEGGADEAALRRALPAAGLERLQLEDAGGGPPPLVQYATHAAAVAALADLDVRAKDGSGVSLIGKACLLWNDMPIDKRGWPKLELAVSVEAEAAIALLAPSNPHVLYAGWGPLSIKEYFTYGGILPPRAFDANRYAPFGGGACAGRKLVLSKEAEVNEVEATAGASALLGRMPADDKEAFQQKVPLQTNKLPAAARALPGFQVRLAAEQPLTVLDLEVSFCWFQAFIESGASKWTAEAALRTSSGVAHCGGRRLGGPCWRPGATPSAPWSTASTATRPSRPASRRWAPSGSTGASCHAKLWIDRCCPDQSSPDAIDAGLASLSTFISQSESMVAFVSESYFCDLRCPCELATLRRGRERELDQRLPLPSLAWPRAVGPFKRSGLAEEEHRWLYPGIA